MTYLLFIGVITSPFCIPLIFDEYPYAVNSSTFDDSFSNADSDYPDITNIPSFQSDIVPPYIKTTSPNHCSPSFVTGTVLVHGILSLIFIFHNACK